MTASRKAFKNSKIAGAIVVLFVTIFIVLSAILLFLLGMAAVENIDEQVLNVIDVWENRVIWSVVVMLIFFVLFVFRIPPEKQKLNEIEIDRLNKLISLKEYEDLELITRDDPLTDHEIGLVGHGTKNFLKIALQIRNNGGVKVRCGLKLTSLLYSGKGFVLPIKWDDSDNSRIESPTPIESKYLKWDEGYTPIEGKIDLQPNGGFGNLLLAESKRYEMGFWLWYIDGKSQNSQILEGRYWAVIQLFGDYEVNGAKSGLAPLKYEVEFIHQNRKLDIISIKKTAS